MVISFGSITVVLEADALNAMCALCTAITGIFAYFAASSASKAAREANDLTRLIHATEKRRIWEQDKKTLATAIQSDFDILGQTWLEYEGRNFTSVNLSTAHITQAALTADHMNDEFIIVEYIRKRRDFLEDVTDLHFWEEMREEYRNTMERLQNLTYQESSI